MSRALAVDISCPHTTPRLYSELVKRQDGTHRGGTKLLSDPHDGLLSVSLLEAPVRQMSTDWALLQRPWNCSRREE